MLMETGAAILLVTPIIYPIAKAVGVDQVHFGVIMTFNLAVGRVTAAQAADELLNISGIDASFVLFPDADGERVVISARSMGDTNVQVVLEKLGGGGNAATAGAQVPSGSVEEVLQRLLRAIDQYFEED